MLKEKDYKNTAAIIISSFISVLLFVYILLFEFILPINKFLPKPSILIASIPDLIDNYNFGYALITTVSVVFISLFLGYLIIKIFNKAFIISINLFPKILYLHKISDYFIPFFLILLFGLWFNTSIWFEFLFAFILVMGKLKFRVLEILFHIPTEYLESAKSLGISQKVIQNDVIWKIIQPKLFDAISKYFRYLLGWILVYEFVLGSNGIGNVLRLSLKYKDVSIVVLSILILIILNLLGSLFLKTIKNKFFFWEI